MPIHDWTRVGAGTFHAFHHAWIAHLMEALNEGMLPPDYYALTEAPPNGLRRTLAIHHIRDHRLITMVDILSPEVKAIASAVVEFVRQAEFALHNGIHFVLIDLFSPGKHDPQGMHGAVMESFSEEIYEMPEG